MAVRRARGEIAQRIAQQGWNYGAEFEVSLPCPACNQMAIKGWMLVDDKKRHQHTIYVCINCDWEGWVVPEPDYTALRAFVAYRHTGEDPAELQPLLEAVCAALAEKDVQASCNFFSEERFQSESLGPRAIMEHAFAQLDGHNILFAVLTSSNKSEGMLMEVGYCWGRSKIVIVAAKAGVTGTYLPNMADYAFVWQDVEDLRRQIANINFDEVLQNAPVWDPA